MKRYLKLQGGVIFCIGIMKTNTERISQLQHSYTAINWVNGKIQSDFSVSRYQDFSAFLRMRKFAYQLCHHRTYQYSQNSNGRYKIQTENSLKIFKVLLEGIHSYRDNPVWLNTAPIIA